MARKTITSVGVEFDMLGLRAARVTTVLQGRETEVKVEELEETTGDYSKDEALAAALKAAGEKLSVKPRDRVVVSLSFPASSRSWSPPANGRAASTSFCVNPRNSTSGRSKSRWIPSLPSSSRC